jgi:hypothetical protein
MPVEFSTVRTEFDGLTRSHVGPASGAGGQRFSAAADGAHAQRSGRFQMQTAWRSEITFFWTACLVMPNVCSACPWLRSLLSWPITTSQVPPNALRVTSACRHDAAERFQYLINGIYRIHVRVINNERANLPRNGSIYGERLPAVRSQDLRKNLPRVGMCPVEVG